MNTVDIFDAKLQQIVPHKVSIDANGEWLFESPSGRFLKLPASVDPIDFDKHFKVHEEVNTGQVNIEEQEAKLAAFLADVNKTTIRKE